jgi:hypothetical protein
MLGNFVSRKYFCSFRNENLVKLSTEFLKSVKSKNDEKEFINFLKHLQIKNLYNELDEDNKKKTFWINIYNTFILLNLRNQSKRMIYPQNKFFKNKNIEIANFLFSFDDIEHKILRKSQLKYFRGYVTNFDSFIPLWEKNLRLNNRDYRIHFALNCGAKSCPPILAYEYDKIENQLELAKKSFIQSDSVFEINKNLDQKSILKVSKIFYWFLGDFKGKSGIIEIHKECGVVPSYFKDSDIKLEHRDYNWKIDI